MQRRFRRPALATAVALTALAAMSTGTEAASPLDGDAVVLTAADGAEVGQAVEQTFTMVLEMSAAGEEVTIALEFVAEAEIVAVAADGGYTVQQMITALSNPGNDPTGQTVVDQMQPMIGVAMLQEIAADGTPGEVEFIDDAPADAVAAFEELGTSISGSPLDFPDTPVAVGDTWSNDVVTETEGVELAVTYDYELVALDDETFTVSVSYATDMDQMGVTGTTSGEGTMIGVRGQPLLIDSTIVSTTEASGGGMTFDQRVDISLDAEPLS
ncbi:MAG: DUF6263 family protein [Desertimonas sp.]